MDGAGLIAFEFILVFGLIFGFIAWDLRSLRRLRQQREAAKKAEEEKKSE